jgi:hypothetical protein
MPCFVCTACGTQFAESAAEPPRCPICEDPRQYVPESGQRWTTLEALRADRAAAIRPEGEYTAIGVEPSFAIGQRALLVPAGERALLWDCVPLVDADAAAEAIGAGGLAGVAISHPHYYTTMVEWAHRFDCPVWLHADDREWVMRPDPAVQLWEGETLELDGGLTLIRCGGHFAGATVLHHPAGADGRGALLTGDVIQVVPDRTHVGFMYSYPNLIPLPAASVAAIAAAVAPFAFEVLYGAWWNAVVRADAKAVVERSAARYARAIEGEAGL